jgi:hypothetical protein
MTTTTIQSQVGTVILSLGTCRFYGESTGIRILSTPVTGMASLLEHETVVLAAQRPGDLVEPIVATVGQGLAPGA